MPKLDATWRRSAENVAKFYDLGAERESSRLIRDPYHMVELHVTLHYLAKHLPAVGHVLDIGGGSGRYCIALARKGYTVTLADVSTELLKIAEREFSKARVMGRVAGIAKADARDLSIYPDETFDAVLALGPIYHLVREKDRARAMDEIVRVARKGAPIFISAISKFGVYRTLLISPEFEHEFTDSGIVKGLRKGISLARWYKESEAFPDAWFCTPRQLKELAEAHDLQTLEMAACEGLSSHHREATNRLYRNKAAWKVWMDFVLKTSNEPSIIGSSEHFLYIGKKKAGGKTPHDARA